MTQKQVENRTMSYTDMIISLTEELNYFIVLQEDSSHDFSLIIKLLKDKLIRVLDNPTNGKHFND